MTPTLSRTFVVCVLASTLALLSPTVSAQIDAGGVDAGGAAGLPTAAPLAASDFTFHLERWDTGQSAWVEMNPTQQQYFFSRARCECDGDTTNYGGYFRVAIEPAPGVASKIQSALAQNAAASGVAALFAGTDVVNCLVPANFSAGASAAYCVNLLDPGDASAAIPGGMATFASTRVWFSGPIPVAWLFNAASVPVCAGTGCDAKAACASTATSARIYFWAQTSSGPAPDTLDAWLAVNLVGQGLPAPSDVTVAGGNEALTVGWSWPSGQDPASHPAFLGVQLFCTRGQDYQVFQSGTFSPSYASSAMMCPGVAPPASTQSAFANLDPRYLCSGLLPATATSYRITGLQNGIPYAVGAATVDKYGNLSPITGSEVVYATPAAVDGGVADGVGVGKGGGCALAGGPASPGASLCLLGLCLLLRARGRRRRPRWHRRSRDG